MMDGREVRLIETMRVEPGRTVPLLQGHMRRVRASCQALGFAQPVNGLAETILHRARELDGDATHRLRLLVEADGAFTLESAPLPPTPEPVKLRVDPNPLSAETFWLRHKTTRRGWFDPAQSWLAAHPDYFDVLFCNRHGEACEGSRCNIYVQDEAGNWLTPPVACGLLPGVQRQALLDSGLVREAIISRNDLLGASRVRVSNALRGWLDGVIIQ